MEKLKISYTEVDKTSYQTCQSGVEFRALINGISCTGFWKPIYQYVGDGVDINDVRVDGRLIEIFDGSSYNKTYEICCRDIVPTERQPKSLRFTGRTLSIKALKSTFINAIKKAVNNPDQDVKLSKEFLSTFNIK
jgi:hypothetical protein